MNKYKIESWDPKYNGQIVEAESKEHALIKVIGSCNDQGYTTATLIK